MVYDELGRVVSTTNGKTVNYAALGRRISVTDAGGVSTSFTYDGLGRVLTETSADRGVTLYSYDAANLLSKTDANGVVINDVYDSMNRLTNINYPSDATRNVSFTYDAAGRKVSMLDIVGVTSYAYNVMGRVIAIDWQPTGMTFIAHVGYSYNNGRLSSITYPSGKVVSYTYDVVSGKLSGMNVNGQPLVSNMVFSPLGVLSSQTLGNGLVETRESDSRGRLTSISSPALARSLVWSPDSMISNINDSLDPYANQSFAYDLSGRLTQATGTYGNITYSYDANGNRMSKSDAAGSSNYVYAAGSNRLQSVAGSNYALDAAGNTTRFDVKRMRYSVNNRMTGYKDASTGIVTNYYHNGLGERVAKKVAGQLTLYMYDLSGNLIAEYDKTTRSISEYTYAPSGRLATLSDQIYWHHNDHLGTPQALTDVNGTVVWTMNQTPFGIVTVNEDPDQDGIIVTNNFRFPGQHYDAESGFNYNYYRTYDPAGGRYTQNDPIGLNGGMNPFGYVGGNPITLYDFWGLYAEVIISDSIVVSRGSQFGHVAIDINGILYSRHHSGWLVEDSSIYIKRQKNLRDSIGLRLDTTATEDKKIVNVLQKAIKRNSDYSLVSDSCSSNVSDILEVIGVQTRGPWQFGTISPADILTNLPKTGRVIQRNFYGKNK